MAARRWTTSRGACAAIIALALVAGACGSDEGPESQEPLGLPGALYFVSTRDRDSGDVFRMSMHDQAVTKVVSGAGGFYGMDLDADGDRIAFARRANGANGLDADIWVAGADGSAAAAITNGPTMHDWFPSWSPDGTRIAFQRSNDGGPFQIFVMAANGAGIAALTVAGQGSNATPDWSPDGSRIAFRSTRDGAPAIFTMKTEGSDLVRVTTGQDYNPHWSPDGSRIAFTSYRDDDNGDIYVVNADGTELVRLTSDPGSDSDPVWSPDGDWIAFVSRRLGNDEVFVVRPDGTELTNVSEHGADEYMPVWGR